MPSTNSEIISRSRTRAAPISGVKARDARVDERVVQDAGIDRIVEDLADGIELHHRPDLGHVHLADIEGRDLEAGRPGVEVDREVGVRPQQPVEQQPGVPAGRRDAVLVAGPFPVHVDQIDAPARIGPTALHAFQRRAGHVRDRHHRARHLRRVELVHHGLDRMDRTHLVAMHAADENDALARPRPLATVTDTYQCCPVGISTP